MMRDEERERRGERWGGVGAGRTGEVGRGAETHRTHCQHVQPRVDLRRRLAEWPVHRAMFLLPYRTTITPDTQVKTYKKVHVRIRRLSDRPVVLPATAAVGFWRETPINRYR